MHYIINQRAKRGIKHLLAGFAALAFAASVALAGGGASAAPGYTLFGEASIVPTGNPGNAAQLVSDPAPGFGGVSLTVEPGMTFEDLTELSSDFNVTDDNCGLGSPRFQVRVDTGGGVLKNIFVYLGAHPGYDTCTMNTWESSGNLLDGGLTHFLDTSQLAGGTFYDTYAHALATYAAYPVVGLSLVIDSGWNATASGGDGEQTVLVDNVMVNDLLVTFEPVTLANKEACKKGGWMESEAPVFKNQGDCVSYFATGGRNLGNGE